MIPHRLPLIGRITRLILTFSLSIGLFLSIVTNERAVAQVEGVASDGDNLTGGSSVDGRRDEVTHPPAPSPVKHSRETYSEEQRFRSCNREPVSGSHRFMMVVSTLDGKVTAVNGLDGLMQWSLSTGTGPLLSSSISQLISSRDGTQARLIPALDGSLYQLDVDGIEAVPLSAEILLSSSYRFSDDSMVVGGKDIETYALDLTAGKVLYMCSAAGCKYFDGTGGKTTTTGPGYDRFGDRRRTGGPGADRDVLIIKRTGKTVRAVDIQSGLEKWNYSVAQHDLTYLSRSFPSPPTAEDLLQQSSCRHRWAAPADEAGEVAAEPGEEAAGRAAGTDEMAADDESSYRDVTIEDVFEDRYYWSGTDPHTPDAPDLTDVTDIDIKVIVPSGLVIAVSRENPDKIYWKYKFDTSIASAWLVDGAGLTDISLFDGQHIPALERNRRLEGDEPLTTTTPSHVGGPGGHSTTEVTNPSHPLNFEQPVIYVGTYNNQLYVQPSVRLTEDLEEERKGATGSAVSMPRVRWKPYIITAPSRTPSVSAHDRYLIGGATDEEQTVETALAPWQDQYPFDTGYYLYYDYTPIRLPLSEASRHDDDDNDISASLLVWWKEVAAISILTSLVLHFTCHLIVRRFYSRRVRRLSESLLCKYDADQSQISGRRSARNSESVQLVTSGECDQIINTAASASRESSTSDQNDYISRYLSDFDQRACLGKGGFGVVFSVVNKLDDCEYAIKRITLNDSDTAKEKVTREVKALAKLDHPGIVRYYQSWFERPPPGWQEQMDRICIDMSLATPTNGFNPASLASIGTSQMTDVFSRRRSLKVPEPCVNKAKPKEVNPLRPFDMFDSFGDGAGFSEFSGTDAGNSHSVMDAGGDKSCTSTNTNRAARCSRKTVSNKNTSNGNCDTSNDISKDWGDESSNVGPLNRLNDDDDDDVSWCDDAPAPDDDEESSLDSGFSLRRPSVHGNSVRSSSDRFNTDDSLEICFCDETSGDKPVSQSGVSQSGVSKSGSVSIGRGRGSACKGSQLAKSLDVSFTHPKNLSNDDSLSIIFSNDASNSPRKNPTAGKSSTETTPKSRCRSAPSSRPNSLSLSGDSAWTNQGAVRDLIDMKKAPPPAKLYLYIQMQLCQRESLKDWLNNHTLNRDKSLLIDMFHQIVCAIDYVHECGLMHRDLKPSNIFFAMNGQIKIGDFGLVTAAASEGGGGLKGMTPMNPRGGKHTDQVGTQLYMSPEQCAGLTYTHKVDIYALGMIFFELYYPFSTQMERVDTLRAVRCLKFPQRFTRELAQQYELVTQLVSHDPAHRPSTLQILEHSLIREHEQSSELLYQRLRRQRTYSSGKSSGGSSAGALTPLVPLENVEFNQENHVKSDNGSTSGVIRQKENTKNGGAGGEKIQIRENSESGSIVFEA